MLRRRPVLQRNSTPQERNSFVFNPSNYSQVPRPGPGGARVSVVQRLIRSFMESRRAKLYGVQKTAPVRAMFTTERRFTVPAPCMGGGFDFEVSVAAVWSGQGSTASAHWALERAEPEHREDVEKQIRELARSFEPDALTAAEVRINEELALPWTYESGLLTCRSRVRVGPDEALCRHLQKLWINQSDDEAQQARAKRHIEHLTELRELWEDFLRQVYGPMAAPAVRLASNSRLVGDVASDVAKEKQDTMLELRRIVDRAAGDHENRDLYEYATSYDSALRKLIQHLDISTAADNGSDTKVV